MRKFIMRAFAVLLSGSAWVIDWIVMPLAVVAILIVAASLLITFYGGISGGEFEKKCISANGVVVSYASEICIRKDAIIEVKP